VARAASGASQSLPSTLSDETRSVAGPLGFEEAGSLAPGDALPQLTAAIVAAITSAPAARPSRAGGRGERERRWDSPGGRIIGRARLLILYRASRRAARLPGSLSGGAGTGDTLAL
jgi:hypothetical protein